MVTMPEIRPKGSEPAVEMLITIVYAERPGHTLDSVTRVHEVYLRLIDQTPTGLHNRVHFCGIAARLTRRILTDNARAHGTAKRGGGLQCISFRESLYYTSVQASAMVALDDALSALEAFDQRKSKMLELHYFAGLTLEETAEAFGLSLASTGRELKLGEAWLYHQIKKSPR